QLTIDGAVLDTREIPRIGPHESTPVWFMGPVCEKTVKAEVDPLDEIQEVSRRDNRLFRACSL
ncbi:MAG: hypothetical protein M3331_07355, partial [Actinomycetota bacterium]|nr:hypothetical protein [Actinomycetota bacterium]